MTPPKVTLVQTPTPLHRLDRMSADLGIDLWIKRDDLTGFAMGGNKGRKLEYLIADALRTGADTVVTCGAAQSNFIRQLGPACSVFGLRCLAAVMRLPFDKAAGKPSGVGASPHEGNERLDSIAGVDLRVFPDDDWEVLYAHMESLAEDARRAGARPYVIPVGGSAPLGAYAFYEAAKEIAQPFDWIVTPSSSGSTQTGLAYAYRGSSTRVLGICSDPEPEIVDDFAALGQGLVSIVGGAVLSPEEFLLETGFVGPGYGVPSDEGWQAIETLARREGIFLDPIYTGKAFGALMSLAKAGKIAGRVLFWHTGGLPALFAFPAPDGLS